MSQLAFDAFNAPDYSDAVSTARLHPQHRPRVWTNAVARAFGAHQEARREVPDSRRNDDGQSLSDVHGSIQFRRFPGVTISKVSANGHSISIQGRHGQGREMLSLCITQTKGETTFRTEKSSTNLVKGDVALITAESHIEITSASDFEYIVLNLRAHSSPEDGAVVLGRDSLHSAILFLVQRLADVDLVPCDSELASATMETTSRLLEVAFRKGAHPSVEDMDASNSFPRVVKQYIEDHLHETHLSIEAIANALLCSRRTIYRTFAADGSDETVSRYIWRRRIERCAEMLRCGGKDETLTRLSRSLGFSSSAQFSRLFKQHMGVSPLAFRRSF